MTDERRPPPRFPRPLGRGLLPPRGDEPEVTRVEEDPIPNTERLPMIPPAPRVPVEPFRRIDGRPPSYVEFQAQLGDFSQKLEAVISSEAAVLGVQRKMALQIDGLGVTVNSRFDLFHKELALLRAVVVGDHAPRLEAAEKTLGQKAVKGGSILTLILLALPMLAEALPKYAHVFETILGALQ